MKMRNQLRRCTVLLLTVSLLLSLAACGGGTSAASMRLRRAEGTVSVSDGDGKNVPLLDNLGLYSGYGVDTRSESYAWIDLDDVKLAKMDQDSEIAIQKDGKYLEIEVKSGSLFFNVSKPLADDETMNIRASTMLVGIRGTCGWVEDNGGLPRVYLLEGKVECSAEGQTVQVNAGEMAKLTEDGELTVSAFPARDIPAFVLDEVAEDKDLAQTILEASGIDVLNAGQGGAVYEPKNMDDLFTALRSAQGGEVIRLAGDIDANAKEMIDIFGGDENNPVVLDLNGYTITSGSYIEYNIYGALQIRDSDGSRGMMTGGNIYPKDSSHLFLDSGTINTSFGGSGAFIIMDGGTIDCDGETVYIPSGSTFTMNGGTINGANDAAVNITDNAAFIMNDGTINGANGAAASISSGSTFTMNGGTVNGQWGLDEKTGATGYSVAVQIFGDATFTMNDGTINGNIITLFAGSIFTQNGGILNGTVY